MTETLSRGSLAIIGAIAVAICSAAPEFIWQGFLLVVAHMSWSTVISAILVAVILVFFVEPILELLRIWLGNAENPSRGTSRHLAVTAAVGIFLALMSVGLHDAMLAFTTAGEQDGEAGIQRAVNVTISWGAVPFAVMLAWQAAAHRILAIPLGVIAAASSFIAGWYFQWELDTTLTTAVPCLAIQLAGYRRALEPHRDATYAHYAPTLAVVAIVWLAAAFAYDGVVRLLHGGWPTLYDPTDYAIDARFYLGWFLGLVLTRPTRSSGSTPKAA
jgi:hypothetical protein